MTDILINGNNNSVWIELNSFPAASLSSFTNSLVGLTTSVNNLTTEDRLIRNEISDIASSFKLIRPGLMNYFQTETDIRKSGKNTISKIIDSNAFQNSFPGEMEKFPADANEIETKKKDVEKGLETANSVTAHFNSILEIVKLFGGKLAPWLQRVLTFSESLGAVWDVAELAAAPEITGILLGLDLASATGEGRNHQDISVKPETEMSPGIDINWGQAMLQYEKQKYFRHTLSKYRNEIFDIDPEAKYKVPGAMIYKNPVPEIKNPLLEAMVKYVQANKDLERLSRESEDFEKVRDMIPDDKIKEWTEKKQAIWKNVVDAKNKRESAMQELSIAKQYAQAIEQGPSNFKQFVREQQSFYSAILPFAPNEADKIAKPFERWVAKEANAFSSDHRKASPHYSFGQSKNATTITFTKPLIGNFTINVKDSKEGIKDFKKRVEEALLEIIDSVNAQN